MNNAAEHGWDVVIVGAGIAGLCAASELVAAGRRVLVLEKSRGVGGRMATRRIGEAVFDHGAQFFTIKGRAFGNVVGDAHRAGVVEKWCEAFAQATSVMDGCGGVGAAKDEDRHARWRGVRGMTDLPKRIVEATRSSGGATGGSLEVRTAAKVLAVGVDGGRVRIEIEEGGGLHAAAAIVTAPAPQAIDLFRAAPAGPTGAGVDPEALRVLSEIAYDPCFTLMILLDRPSLVPAPGAIQFDDGPVAWIADNRVKGISPVSALTVNASGPFSRLHFDDPADAVADRLVDAVRPWIDGDPATAVRERSLHRWKFATAVRTAGAPLVAVSTAPPIVCCGDGFGGPRIEAAASSGLAGARWLARTLGPARVS